MYHRMKYENERDAKVFLYSEKLEIDDEFFFYFFFISREMGYIRFFFKVLDIERNQ